MKSKKHNIMLIKDFTGRCLNTKCIMFLLEDTNLIKRVLNGYKCSVCKQTFSFHKYKVFNESIAILDNLAQCKPKPNFYRDMNIKRKLYYRRLRRILSDWISYWEIVVKKLFRRQKALRVQVYINKRFNDRR